MDGADTSGAGTGGPTTAGRLITLSPSAVFIASFAFSLGPGSTAGAVGARDPGEPAVGPCPFATDVNWGQPSSSRVLPAPDRRHGGAAAPSGCSPPSPIVSFVWIRGRCPRPRAGTVEEIERLWDDDDPRRRPAGRRHSVASARCHPPAVPRRSSLRVLVAHASAHGSTAEIATRLASDPGPGRARRRREGRRRRGVAQRLRRRRHRQRHPRRSLAGRRPRRSSSSTRRRWPSGRPGCSASARSGPPRAPTDRSAPRSSAECAATRAPSTRPARPSATSTTTTSPGC